MSSRAKNFRLVLAAGAALAACLLFSPADAAGHRVALIVGNAAYVSLPALTNSVNDSAKVRDTLRDAGFDTFYGADLTRVDLETLIQRFFRAADDADIAIFYYSGHGVQVGGDNFIVPVDTKLATPYDIEQQTVKVADIFNYVSVHSRAQLIFLDACRNNPFKIDRFWVGDTLKVTDSKHGLARSDYGVGSLIAFSTEPGAVAYDGMGQLSPYTSALVRHITAPNEEIRRALTLVRREVIAATHGQQVPWENSSLVDDVYLMPAPPAPSVPAMVRVSVPEGDSPVPIKLPRPQRSTDDGLTVRIEQLPDQGQLLLKGRSVEAAQPLTFEDLDNLSFSAKGLPQGAIGLIAYLVSDKWQQTARGVVAITVDASAAAANASAAQASARSSALVAARDWFHNLDRTERSTPIGVGPVLLSIAGPPTTTSDTAAAIVVAKAPDAGVLKLGDRSITRGQQIALNDLPNLAFQPPVGGEGHPETIGLELVGVPGAAISLAVKPVLDDCDKEAASPLDLQGVGVGKLPNEINATKAVAACERAVRGYPSVPRFRYQLGRAQLAGGSNEDARVSIAAAASAKHTRAIWELGNFEALGAFAAADLAKANMYYQQCSDAGDAYCFLAFGRDLYYGRGVTTDVKRGIELMLRAAELGHTYAMNELGYIFLYARGAHGDKERGLRFYEAGAQRDDIYSLNNLGLVYLRGAGRPADSTKALSYFTLASKGGHPFAPTNLGRMARDGVGGPKDPAAAAKWLELAAERGDYWGALDRGRLATDAAVAAKYFALAVSLNREGDNFDKEKQALAELVKIAAPDKTRALEQLGAELGAEAIAITGTLDDRLIESQGRAWQKRNPRFDLF